ADPRAFGLEGGDPVDRQIDRADLVEQQIVALARRPRDRFGAAGAHPERRMGFLDRRRLDHDVLEMPALAVMREAPGRAPRLADDLDRLVEALGRLVLWDAEALELGRPVTLADAEIDPAVGEQVERRDLLCKEHRI